VIENTLARGYEVTKQVVYMTNNKSYRSYVMVELSKKEVRQIIEEINKKKVAFINPSKLEKSAKSILNK